jgi:hypothetical protein
MAVMDVYFEVYSINDRESYTTENIYRVFF